MPTPQAATQTELLHLIIYIPRVEALDASTLGHEIATSTELAKAPPLPLNHLLAIADIDAGRQRVPVLRHLDALQRVDALLAGGHIGVYGTDAVGGGLYD